MNLFYYASTHTFAPLAARLVPWCFRLAVLLTLVGLFIGLVMAPTDFQQGDAYRIIFIHVPAAWMSMIIYLVMAFWAAVGLAFRARLASMLALALAPTGALMTLIALFTGAIWGRPTWGTYWVWDARLTSELILLFLYLGFLSLHGAIEDTRRADRSAAVLAIVCVVNVPIIYFSVRWWNTLHQGASVTLTQAPRMATVMFSAMIIMTFAFWAYCIGVALLRCTHIIRLRNLEADSSVNPLPPVLVRELR